MAEKESKVIKEAKESYDVLTGDEEVKRLAEIRLMSHLEEQAALACAREAGLEKGMQEGLEKGMQEGFEKGMQEGHEQGKKEGLNQAQKEIARKMKEQKIDIKTIMKITGLTEEEIEKNN